MNIRGRLHLFRTHAPAGIRTTGLDGRNPYGWDIVVSLPRIGGVILSWDGPQA